MSDRKPMLARAPETSDSAGGPDRSSSRALKNLSVPLDAQPDEILERIRTLLTDQSIAARRLAIEALSPARRRSSTGCGIHRSQLAASGSPS